MARIDKPAHQSQERGQADGGGPGSATYSDDGPHLSGKTTSPKKKPVLKPGVEGDQ